MTTRHLPATNFPKSTPPMTNRKQCKRTLSINMPPLSSLRTCPPPVLLAPPRKPNLGISPATLSLATKLRGSGSHPPLALTKFSQLAVDPSPRRPSPAHSSFGPSNEPQRSNPEPELLCTSNNLNLLRSPTHPQPAMTTSMITSHTPRPAFFQPPPNRGPLPRPSSP